MLYEYDQQTYNRIVIVTVTSIAPFENMFDFSLKLAQVTNAGPAKNEIMIVVSKSLRELQIQNVDGIAFLLTDEETKSIVENIMIPAFKKDNYFLGLKSAILEIQKELD